ncbi:MAG: hypothetical protein ACLUPK_00085 [Veillonella sp.]
MSNSVIKRELTALLQDKEYFEFLRHQRILVTGATGLIGSMFIKLLILANETFNLDIKVIGHVRSHDKAQAIFGNYLDNDFHYTYRWCFRNLLACLVTIS